MARTATAEFKASPSIVTPPQAPIFEDKSKEKPSIYTSQLAERAGFMYSRSYLLLGCMIQFNKPAEHEAGAEYCAEVYGPNIIEFNKELTRIGIGNKELDAIARAIRNGITYDDLNKAPQLLEQITEDILAKALKGK